MGLNADLTPLAADGQSLDESSAAAGACSPRKGTASSSLSSNSQLHAHALQGQPDAEQDSRKPIYHVMPLSGWSSDPCGAIRYKGNYHLFYQHHPDTCQWYWGVGWGHVYSPDLVTWHWLPPALLPTPGHWDADGCFTGSVQINPTTQEPFLLYTGARQRSNPAVAHLPAPPVDQDMGLVHLESQLCATCSPGDVLLQDWRKVDTPWLTHPPSSQLTAWRDPWFLDEQQEEGREEGVPRWRMLLGSGVKGKGGSILLYGSNNLAEGWHLESELCSWPDNSLGANWEVPFLVQPRQVPAEVLPHTSPTPAGTGMSSSSGPGCPLVAAATGAADGPVMASVPLAAVDPQQLESSTAASAAAVGAPAVSAWLQGIPMCADGSVSAAAVAAASVPVSATRTYSQSMQNSSSSSSSSSNKPWLLATALDLANCEFNGACIYWLGQFDQHHGKFDLEAAAGPLPLDLGNVFYAPTCFNDDANGRHVVWGFVKELREVPPAPCLSNAFSYAGCVSLPRALYLHGGRLFQVPLPELAGLRCGPSWCGYQATHLHPGLLLPVPGVKGVHLEVNINIRRGTATGVGLSLSSWREGQVGAALLSFDWPSQQLEVHLDPAAPEGLSSPSLHASVSTTLSSSASLRPAHSSTQLTATKMSLCSNSSSSRSSSSSSDLTGAGPTDELTAPCPTACAAMEQAAAEEEVPPVTPSTEGSHFDPYATTAPADTRFEHFKMRNDWAGGRLFMGPDKDLQLHIFLDGSCLEVFTSTGQTLTTRVYRGHPPLDCQDAGLHLFAVGGSAVLQGVEAYEVGSCWREVPGAPLDSALHQ